MVNKASILPMKLTGWNFKYWLLLSLLVPVFLSASLAYGSDFKNNDSVVKSSVLSSLQLKNVQSKNNSVEQLLKKFVQNGARQLFNGTFVYFFEDSLQTIKVNRDINAEGEIVEEFIPLDSNQKQSKRVLVNHYCSLDNGWPYQFHAVSSSFPFRINNHYEYLKKSYNFILSDTRTVAGIPAIGLSIKAKDPYRYGYKLWFEPETGTLLRYQLIDHKDKIVEQYLFTDIKFNSSSEVSSSSDTSKDLKSCLEEFQEISSVFKQHFNIDKIPDGYEPVSYRKGIINEGKRRAYQFQLSDGISSVSIFIEETGQIKRSVNGVVKLGPVNVAGNTIDEHQITVIGAIPIASALRFLKAVKEPAND
ncbi:MAG: MucB/RseB C-terminal domain-containing protein [gamma proteobacterium symbiont of Bathyaustriella thionipta]|nr:MucB/RseB C-terminal domain-containing protein [gamma proteobacterium symbiont of Bathyaustriella thionipta]MCU7949872.1 MucB/RseB C-terminal domain-containing protein [gamma proteobacterium symbiont of Bathyaustriella thionipta]MCU7952114.1 MucB/RseB C-terminal domain-containing protein [gamma proteobacterium symbiont of Bathyaustriella thionipta]MCU7956466.1 MucB/RseB C-terminal domain-containing protein [gamma proteobacterium symbiont of Bathyaustriella thionipta]MCU7965793.1 MucB/RseB C-